MKAYWGSGGTSTRILDLDTRWRSVATFTPQPLYPQRKSLLYPLHRGLQVYKNDLHFTDSEAVQHFVSWFRGIHLL